MGRFREWDDESLRIAEQDARRRASAEVSLAEYHDWVGRAIPAVAEVLDEFVAKWRTWGNPPARPVVVFRAGGPDVEDLRSDRRHGAAVSVYGFAGNVAVTPDGRFVVLSRQPETAASAVDLNAVARALAWACPIFWSLWEVGISSTDGPDFSRLKHGTGGVAPWEFTWESFTGPVSLDDVTVEELCDALVAALQRHLDERGPHSGFRHRSP